MIKIICIGKIKENYLKDAINDYQKRISKYHKIEIVELPDSNIDNEKELTIMIDYAHSPESLESILNTVREYTQGKVICVFGCGGDRDSGKRPIMGEISGVYADYTIITSDNPRSEEPEEIINQIEKGIKKTKGSYECIIDRKEAIKKGIQMLHKKDILVIAGKGHELTQEIKGKKIPFDEREIIHDILKNNTNN